MVDPEKRNLGRREGQVCLTLSAEAISHDVSGVWRLLTFWGGEPIYWHHAEPQRRPVHQRTGSSGQDLTTAGTYIEMTSRVFEPALLALTIFAIRGRIKR
ncbi:hypothetical protein ACIRL0_36000 [Streptomyces sp. NPDC102365]|uniref:hypothetical protein n=1 Tax=Streptomyces sp. NPDC102365 TaxID=3366162 RepID=UPI00381E8C00